MVRLQIALCVLLANCAVAQSSFMETEQETVIKEAVKEAMEEQREEWEREQDDKEMFVPWEDAYAEDYRGGPGSFWRDSLFDFDR